MTQCVGYNRCNHKDCDKEYCARRARLEILYKMSMLSDSQLKPITLCVDSDNTDLEEFKYLNQVANNIKEFVSEGRNLLIYSKTCGNGKTSWSIKIAQSFIESVWAEDISKCRVLFISVPRFLLALKENITQKSEYVEKIKQRLSVADLVIWDDIGAKAGSEYEINHLLSYIDGRIALGKSNIFTSNLGEEALYAALGDRLASRICHMSQVVEFRGSDKRIYTQYSKN